MKRILITGATGKSGKYFIDNVCEHFDELTDYQFGFIVRNEKKCNEIKEKIPNAEVYIGDLKDEQFLGNVFFNGFETLLHISGIEFSLLLSKVAVKHSIKWLILVHTTGIYSKYKAAGENYRNIEKQIEQVISGTDVALTILRPTMIYGTLQDRMYRCL